MKKFAFVLIAFFAVLFFQIPAFAQAPRTMNAAEIELAFKKLGTLCSVLHIAAHPDDENTALLAYLANERLCRTGYLSLTRGEGGQNLIGAEKGAALGVIRTQELLAARRIDGAEQFFTRAIDFGFSKTAEETLAKWNKQEVLSDVVYTIRKFRPDVVITRFPPDARAGHGHHQSSAILAEEAFKLAGDAKAFPEQLKYVQIWQPKRLLWNAFVRGNEAPPADALKIDVGAFNPLLGKSYTEIAAISRSQHKSQGFGSAERRGSRVEFLTHVAGDKAAKDLLDGIDISWKRIEGGEPIGISAGEILAKFNSENTAETVPRLAQMYKAALNLRIKIVESQIAAERKSGDIPSKLLTESHYLFIKEAEIYDLIRTTAGIWLEAISSVPVTTTGAKIEVKFAAINRLSAPVKLLDVGSIFGSVENLNVSLVNNQVFSQTIPAKIAIKDSDSQPFWLEFQNNGYLANLDYLPNLDDADNSELFSEQARIEIEKDIYEFNVPVLYRFVDRVNGEIYRRPIVAPPVVVNLTEPLYVFSNVQAKQIRLTVKNNANVVSNAVLKLELPTGWKAEPSEIPIAINEKGAEISAVFNVAPTANAKSGKFQAFAEINDERLSKQQIIIDYPHIPQQTLFPAAEANLVKLDIKTGQERIGYIVGSGDEIPESLRQIGYDVKLISDEELQTADLTKDFDTIIAGIRAYNTRQILRKTNQRILDFVKSGGTFLVQYNTTDDTLQQNFAPFPIKIGRERVTVEEAPVKFLAADHPVLNFPNKITAQDFDGYVQERGTYFASEFAPEFVPILEMHDPNEKEQIGSLLVANHGKGKFIYTGIAFFRQLPAGIPGAYRLFANLVSNQNKR